MSGKIPYAGPSLYWREEHDLSSLVQLFLNQCCVTTKSQKAVVIKIPRCNIIKYHLTIDVKLTCVTRE